MRIRRVHDGYRSRSEGEQVVPEEEAVPAGPFCVHGPVGDDRRIDTVAVAGEGEPEPHLRAMPTLAPSQPSSGHAATACTMRSEMTAGRRASPRPLRVVDHTSGTLARGR
jgi:hypothetical protein